MASSEATNQQASNRLLEEIEPHDIDMENLEDVEIEEHTQIEGQTQTGTETQTEGQPATKKRKAHKQRSMWWNDTPDGFKVVFVEEGDPPVKIMKGKCNWCGTLIAADSVAHGTNGLKNHNKACKKKHESKSVQTTQTQLNFTQNTDGTTGMLTTWRFDQKTCRLALCEMIILDELPFLFLEREGFRRFVERVCPQFQIPSRHTIREDCVKLFLEHKDNLKTFFKRSGMGRVSITTDCWTAVNNTNFICVIAHCIGKDWVLHKKIISFSKIISHKGMDIGESIVSSLIDWGLQNVLCCTMDNASANDGVVKHLLSYLETKSANILGGKYIHMRCAAHIINLVVLDGLEEIGLSIRRVREAVKWMKASPMRLGQFRDCAKLLNVDCTKSLSLDVPTRWNSTYMMLESALPYEDVFRVFGTMYSTSGYDTDLMLKKHNGEPLGPPKNEDWDKVKKMSQYLKKFYDLTLLVSGTSYATSHLFFVEMCDLFDHIGELEFSDDLEVRSMTIKMRMKIGKYWLEDLELNPKMNKIIYLATVLDPKQKMEVVEKCLSSMYTSDRASDMVREVKDSFTGLYEFYLTQTTTSANARVHKSATANTSRRGRGTISKYAGKRSGGVEKSDLTLYLSEELENDDDDFDILLWWSKNAGRYPVLSEMAKDILAIQISSVASESAFSMGGRVVDSYRSSLTPKMVEALICAEDWLKSSSSDKNDEGVCEEQLEKEFEYVLKSYAHGGATNRPTDTTHSESGQPQIV